MFGRDCVTIVGLVGVCGTGDGLCMDGVGGDGMNVREMEVTVCDKDCDDAVVLL